MKQVGVKEVFLVDLLFNVFDADHDGKITFQEFAYSISVLTRGTPAERLNCMLLILLLFLIIILLVSL